MIYYVPMLYQLIQLHICFAMVIMAGLIFQKGVYFSGTYKGFQSPTTKNKKSLKQDKTIQACFEKVSYFTFIVHSRGVF
jgi:hypothetical protein